MSKKMTHLLVFTNLLVLACLAISSCGKVYSAAMKVDVIMPNISGYICFLIRDEDGKGVGGNCLKQD